MAVRDSAKATSSKGPTQRAYRSKQSFDASVQQAPAPVFARMQAGRRGQIGPHDVLALQRTIGNHSTSKLLQRYKDSSTIHNVANPVPFLQRSMVTTILQRDGDDVETSLQNTKNTTESPEKMFTELTVISDDTNVNKLYKVKTQDGKYLVLKIQSDKSATNEYLLGKIGSQIGLDYPDSIKLYMDGTQENTEIMEGLAQYNIHPDVRCIIVMPFFDLKMNKLGLSHEHFIQLGKAFALDIFTFGKDRFPINDNMPFNNLFFTENEGQDNLITLDTSTAWGKYTKKEDYEAKVKNKLNHKVRKYVFERALGLLPPENVLTKKMKQEYKEVFYQGIIEGFRDIFLRERDIEEVFTSVQQTVGPDQPNKARSELLDIDVGGFLNHFREILKSKKAMHTKGKVYKFVFEN